MHALELLRADHQKVQELFEQVKATENEKQHKQLYQKIKPELEMHTYGEEKVLYPRLKQDEVFKDQVLEAMEEHLQVKTLLRDIERLAENSERFAAKLKVLIDNVEHHVAEEEDELFPQVEAQFSVEELETLGLELQAAKKDFTKASRAKAAGAK